MATFVHFGNFRGCKLYVLAKYNKSKIAEIMQFNGANQMPLVLFENSNNIDI